MSKSVYRWSTTFPKCWWFQWCSQHSYQFGWNRGYQWMASSYTTRLSELFKKEWW